MTGRLVYVDSPRPGTTANNLPQTVRTTYAYTALGNLASVTAPGRDANTTTLTTYTYDSAEALGEPLTVTIASSAASSPTLVSSYAYDPRGTTRSITDALGHETDFAYDLTDRTTDVTYPLTTPTALHHATSHTAYLYLGGPVTEATFTDENQATIRQTDYHYGVDGELLSVSGSAEPVSYTYDALYRTKTLTDGNGGSHTTHYYYNGRGYLDAVTYPGYGGPSPTPNANGCYNVTGADSVRFQTTDANGNLVPAYNLNGQVTRRIDGRGAATQYQYNDVENQLTGLIYGTGTTRSVTLNYDAVYGRLTSVADTVGTYGWTYDDLNLPQTATTQYTGLPTWTLTYGYNPDGSRTQTQVSKGGAPFTFTYGYDGVGRPLTLSNPAGQTFGWNYLQDASSRSNSWLAGQTATAGSATLYGATYAYDGQGRLTALANTTGANGAGTVLSAFGSAAAPMTYDGAGNRVGMNVSVPGAAASYSGNVSYVYDPAASTDPTTKRGQLTAESNPRVPSGGGGFAYDAAGNPTTFRSQPTSGYNADNQPSGNTYDGNGSPSLYNGATCVYDVERRLTSLTTASVKVTAGYRADGLRAWKDVANIAQGTNSATRQSNAAQSNAAQSGVTSTRAYFLYDGGRLLAELDSSGNAASLNTWGPTGLLARQNLLAGTSSVYTFDPSGNVSQRLDGSGNVQGSYAFDAFGKGVTSDAAPEPYQYGGQWGVLYRQRNGSCAVRASLLRQRERTLADPRPDWLCGGHQSLRLLR